MLPLHYTDGCANANSQRLGDLPKFERLVATRGGAPSRVGPRRGAGLSPAHPSPPAAVSASVSSRAPPTIILRSVYTPPRLMLNLYLNVLVVNSKDVISSRLYMLIF